MLWERGFIFIGEDKWEREIGDEGSGFGGVKVDKREVLEFL